MEPRNWFQGMNSANLCSLAGRYNNPIPPRFLAPIDSLKISVPVSSLHMQQWSISDCQYTVEQRLPIKHSCTPPPHCNVHFNLRWFPFGPIRWRTWVQKCTNRKICNYFTSWKLLLLRIFNFKCCLCNAAVFLSLLVFDHLKLYN